MVYRQKFGDLATMSGDAIVAFKYRVWGILLVPCPSEVGKAEVGRVFM